ncbi:C-type mannose receptor 2-like isoform X2 [Cebidichthys violaceus]|uniref:C-type mannose receptor 2-like isoform X2 n=1 Tax=Cebidichthys violaceus TaxID=271503 RepID=UPI0035C9DD0C
MIMIENRWIVRKGTQTLYLLFISGFCSFTLGSPDCHLITMTKTYTEAKTYCREMYTDLATVHNSTDMANLITIVPSTIARAWIGLETGDVWMWHWSWPDQKLDFLKWKVGEPQMKNEDACAAMDQQGEWIESDCGTQRSFVCHGNSDISGLIFVAETKSWRDAQNHCRGLSSYLISIQSAEENEAVHTVSASQNVWIGLFKDSWKWSDGSKTSFRYWKPRQPNNLSGQDCVAAIFRDKGQWNDLKCNGKRFFVCNGEAETANNLMTPNTTDLVSSTPNTELNNATTEMSTVTPTKQPPNTTAQVTTDSVSTLTTLMGTSAQTTTPSSTLKPTENSQSFPTDNLILIQENMTWIEAVGYCREHHIDLVHISSKDIQGKVAETAKNATSLHVWIGLRYTCKFNFWFWTKSTSGCYHNWAPGQGSERKYDCDVTGAIEATGRQQWVGLPETEKLNFICYVCTG